VCPLWRSDFGDGATRHGAQADARSGRGTTSRQFAVLPGLVGECREDDGSYTTDEYIDWLNTAGFEDVQQHPLASMPFQVLVTGRVEN
jgi:hypothetical protein